MTHRYREVQHKLSRDLNANDALISSDSIKSTPAPRSRLRSRGVNIEYVPRRVSTNIQRPCVQKESRPVLTLFVYLCRQAMHNASISDDEHPGIYQSSEQVSKHIIIIKGHLLVRDPV